jgi:hypothetical protein
MPTKDDGQKGGDVFIVDNSDKDWKVRRYLHSRTAAPKAPIDDLRPTAHHSRLHSAAPVPR